MNDYLATARLHLVDRLSYVILPWATLAFTFFFNLALFAVLDRPDARSTGGLLTLPCFMFVLGVLTLTRSLPFALALGITRRRYYIGSVGLALVASAAWAIAVTALYVIEPVAGGWGIDMHFFRISWLLAGPWYQALATSFVLLALFFVAGMWFGLIYRRWSLPGLVATIAAIVLIVLCLVVLASTQHVWPAVQDFFAGLNIYAATGLAAALTALLGLLGLATIRPIAL